MIAGYVNFIIYDDCLQEGGSGFLTDLVNNRSAPT